MNDEDTVRTGGESVPDTGTEPADQGCFSPADGNGQPPGGETPGADDGPAARIAALEDELAETRNQYLRKAADFENYRKRMMKEKAESADFANQSLILDLLPVIDDLDRAVRAAESAVADGIQEPKDFSALHEGVSMIEKRLLSQLENRWGLKRFDSAGEPFDPNRHEAIMMEKSPEVEEPVVAEDLVKGYVLKDRVIRAAKVKVMMPAAGEPAGEGTAP